MLRAARGGVNALRVRNRRAFAGVPLASGKHFPCKRRTGSKIHQAQVVPPTTQARPAQKYCEYDQCDSAIRLESQRPEKRHQDAEFERLLRRLGPAILAISDDATQVQRSPLKMFFPGKAILTHRPATQHRSRFDFDKRFQLRTRGYIRGSSRARRAFVLRRRARACADLQNVLAQFRPGQKPRKQLLPRHVAPNGRATKPILEPIHENTSYLVVETLAAVLF